MSDADRGDRPADGPEDREHRRAGGPDEQGQGRATAPGPGRPVRHRVAWLDRLILLVAAVVVVAAVLAIAASVLPLWWARRISAMADGTFTAGVAIGLGCGVVSTVLPLLALRGAARRYTGWQARSWLLALAILVAAPNLLTLGMAAGGDANARHARLVISDGAPGFRGATVTGVLAGAVLTVMLWGTKASQQRHRRRIADLESQLRDRKRERSTPGSDQDGDHREPFGPEGS